MTEDADDLKPATEEIDVPGAAQMRGIGSRLAGLLQPGDLVVLTGPLGAGKTTLAQGIGAGLGVRGPVTSPTFVIARVHPSLRGGPDLVHADAYRLGSRLEVDDLDLDADLEHSVTVVEWGEGLVENLAAGHLLITIGWAGGGGAVGANGLTRPGHPAVPEGAAVSEEAAVPDEAGDGGLADEPRIVTVTGYGSRWTGVVHKLGRELAGPPG